MVALELARARLLLKKQAEENSLQAPLPTAEPSSIDVDPTLEKSGVLTKAAKVLDPITPAAKSAVLAAFGKTTAKEAKAASNPMKEYTPDFLKQLGWSDEFNKPVLPVKIANMATEALGFGKVVPQVGLRDAANLAVDVPLGMVSGSLEAKLLSKLGQGARGIARSAARFSPQMEEAYLNSRKQIGNYLENFKTDIGHSEAAQKAQNVINVTKDWLKAKGLADYENTLLAKLNGKNVNVPERVLLEMERSGHPELEKIAKQSREATYADRPFQPEFTPESGGSVQEGVKIKDRSFINNEPDVVSSSLDQPSFFSEEQLSPPKFKEPKLSKVKTPDDTLLEDFKLSKISDNRIEGNLRKAIDQDERYSRNLAKGRRDVEKYKMDDSLLNSTEILPKTPLEKTKDLKRYLQQESLKESTDRANLLKQMKNAKQESFVMGGEPMKKELAPRTYDTPSVDMPLEYAGNISYQVQEPLQLFNARPQGSYKMDATKAQSAKKLLQDIADYKPMNVMEAAAGVQAEAKQKSIGDAAYNIQKILEGVDPSIRATNKELQQGLLLQEELTNAQKNPLRYFSGQTKDQRARMGLINKRLGNESLSKEAARIQAATAINPVDIDDALSRKMERFLGRSALNVMDLPEFIKNSNTPLTWSLINNSLRSREDEKK